MTEEAANTPVKPAATEASAPQAPEAPAAAAEASAPAPKPSPSDSRPKTYIWGTGRRKRAVARVRIRPGAGKILVNKREMNEYFKGDRDRASARSPLEVANAVTAYDVWVNVNGGGSTGQADAVKLGLARALVKAIPEAEHALREKGLLTRDARIVERKKYGKKGARKSFQFSKR